MQLANQEALRFNHGYIGAEHILLGLIKEGSGVAANVLKNLVQVQAAFFRNARFFLGGSVCRRRSCGSQP
jgi:hypothetical protein